MRESFLRQKQWGYKNWEWVTELTQNYPGLSWRTAYVFFAISIVKLHDSLPTNCNL